MSKPKRYAVSPDGFLLCDIDRESYEDRALLVLPHIRATLGLPASATVQEVADAANRAEGREA
jgi:hypothetical protein